jgi:hypothetical protein
MRTLTAIILAVMLSGCQNTPENNDFPDSRDPYLWPFSRTSIWNMPIGSEAEYKPQPLDPDHVDGVMVDADIIIMTPDEELVNVYGTKYRWGRGTNPETRCERYSDSVYMRLPIPGDYSTTFYGTMPNNGAAVLLPDRRTIVQTQPFQVCPEGYSTTGLIIRDGEVMGISRQEDVDLYGDGYYGAHGGSGLSAIGGAIRVGELSPGSGPIRHALKISLPCKHYLYFDHEKGIGYRWPARKHDSRARQNYTGTEPEAKIGCLRALPPDLDIALLELETEPGRKIAWTLQNYGAYQVEEVPWRRVMMVAEEGPAGNVMDRFREDWGYDFVSQDKEGNPWVRDILKILAHLHIVTNNGPESIGGGGTPLQPLAPELED